MTDKAILPEEREELRERVAAWTNTPLNILSIAMLGIIILELTVNLSAAWSSRLSSVSWFIYVVFTADFLVQLLLAPSKGRYLRRNWVGAISVLLPAFRVFRAIRAVRVLRGLRLVRVITATNRGTRALNGLFGRYRFGRVLGLTVAVVAVGAAALVYFETGGRAASQYGNALWWAAALVTTVGSGFEPVTLEGRVIALLLMTFGIAVFGYITGSVASYLVGQDAAGTTDSELRELRAEMAELRMMLSQALERPDEDGPV